MKVANSKLKETLEYVNERIDEYSSNILGYYETQAYDIVYEEFINALNNIKNRVELILEIKENE